jgi:hypothetical protein
MLKEIITEYADRIVSPVYIGIRTSYLANEAEVVGLDGTEVVVTEQDGTKNVEWKPKDQTVGTVSVAADQSGKQHRVIIVVKTPREALARLAENLP